MVPEEEEREIESVSKLKEHEEPDYESQEQSEDILLPKGCEEDL